MKIRKQLGTTIALIFVILCLSTAKVEKLELHKEEIYEYQQSEGPLIFEMDANLIKNKAEYLLIEVESLTPRTDVQIFVSISGKTPYTQEESDITCSRFDYDVCLIPQSLAKEKNPNSEDIKVIFTIKCNNDCSFELYASYENSEPLKLNDEKILIVKESNKLDLDVVITNTALLPINTFILQAELLNPIEIKHYFSMEVFSTDSTTPVYSADTLGNGPIKGLYEIRGDKICNGQCTLKLKIKVNKGSIMKINTYGYSKFREIEPFKIYSDQVDVSSSLTMKLDLGYFQPINHVDLTQKTVNFQLVPITGTCSLNIHAGLNQPLSLNDYNFKSSLEEDTHNVRIHYDDHKSEHHIYWLNIQSGNSKCLFSIKVDFVDTYNQQITLNHPIASIADQAVIQYYKLTLLGNHFQNIKVILHSDNPHTKLYVQMCQKYEDCRISSKDIGKKNKGVFIGQTGDETASTKAIKFTHQPNKCPDFKPYNDIYDTFPSCTYLIGIYSVERSTKYTIEANSQNDYINYVTIRENESFFDKIGLSEDNTYRFQVIDHINEVKFVVLPQFGEVMFKAFFSKDGSKVNITDSLYALQESQWNEITFKDPKIGFYYLLVQGLSESQYTITPVVDRLENKGKITIHQLKQDIPHQVIDKSDSAPSYFEINIVNYEDNYPQIWINMEQNSNEFDIYITQNKNLLQQNDNSKFEYKFSSKPTEDIHLESDITKTISKKKLYIKVVPKHQNISQHFLIKYHFNFAYSTLAYSKPTKAHIAKDGLMLYRIPVKENTNIQITKTVINKRQQNVRIQIDFNDAFSGLQGFFDDYFTDIISIPQTRINEGCQQQQSEGNCFMFIHIYSVEECDFQIQIDEQVDGSVIMAYDGYSNFLLAPTKKSIPLMVNYVINKPETIIITTQQTKGLSLCATIVNPKNQLEIHEYPSMNDCQFKSEEKAFYDHSYLKISKKDVQENCKFEDSRFICSLALSIFSNAEQDTKEKFRLSISSGVTDVHKGKSVIGHVETENMAYFKYVSTSELPIKFHLVPLDSADLELFVVFGEENRPLAFKDYGWSRASQNYDENDLEIQTPLPIQNGSLKGVYIIGVQSKISYSRFQLTVTQEASHIQELHKSSIYSLKVPQNQSLYFEYTPNPEETEFTIKLAAQYGNPKIAVKYAKLDHQQEKKLPDILKEDYSLSNQYESESDELKVLTAACTGCIYYIQIYSEKEHSKFTLQITSSNIQFMLYNHVYAFKFKEFKKQSFSYHSSELGDFSINMEYGEAEVEVDINGVKNIYILKQFINLSYAFNQDIVASISCKECSFSVQTVKFDDLLTFKFGQFKYINLQPGSEIKMQFSYNPTSVQKQLTLNLMVENIIFDEQHLFSYKPEIKILYIEKRYDLVKQVPYQMHKFHKSYSLQFQGKQGQYSITIKWPLNSLLKQQDTLYLIAFMTNNESVFLLPNQHYSSHIQHGEVSQIIQKKTYSSDLKPEEQGIELVVHVCQGKLSSLLVSPFSNDKFYRDNNIGVENKSVFTMVTNNIFVYDDISLSKELVVELTAASNNTFFSLHTQPIHLHEVSLYKKIFLENEQITFGMIEEMVILNFRGVSIMDEFLSDKIQPKIKYEIYFFRKVQDIQNQLCPQVDLLELENPSSGQNQKQLQSGLLLTAFTSNRFNIVESFSIEKKKIMEERNFDEFYFTIQASVTYNNQEANLMYNIEQVNQIILPDKNNNSEDGNKINWILYVIIAGSLIVIIFLIILIRRKMKYGLLQDNPELQIEEVGQQELSQVKAAPNHVISPDQSIMQQQQQKQAQQKKVGSQVAFMNPSIVSMDIDKYSTKNEQNA